MAEVKKRKQISFEKLDFEEFIEDDIFSFKIPVSSNEEEEVEVEIEETEFSPILESNPALPQVYEELFKIKQKYIHMLYNGMKPYMFHTNFKITRHLFKYLDDLEGLEFFRCVTQYRGIVCFGKLFDEDEQKVKMKRAIDKYESSLGGLSQLETLKDEQTK